MALQNAQTKGVDTCLANYVTEDLYIK